MDVSGNASVLGFCGDRLYALVPTRTHFNIESHAGTAFLTRAGFDVQLLDGYPSIHSGLASGVSALAGAEEDDIVLLMHDDVHFNGLPEADFVRALRRHLAMPAMGFVGVAGARMLLPELAWWRNASSMTALAGMVHHGLHVATARRSFFGPPGRVAVLDGVVLAATVRTLRRVVRLEDPTGATAAWHFYDISWTLQSHAAGLTNVALPLGVYHRSTGKPDAAWEAARTRLARRLLPLLPTTVNHITDYPTRRRVAILLNLTPAERRNIDARVPGSIQAARDTLLAASFEVLDLSPSQSALFHLLDAATRGRSERRYGDGVPASLASLSSEDILLLARSDVLLLTPPADLSWFVEAALRQPRTLASSIGCRRPCSSGGSSGGGDSGSSDYTGAGDGGAERTTADVGSFMAISEEPVSGGGGIRLTGGQHAMLHTLAPPGRVSSFSRSGMLFGRWETFQQLHTDPRALGAPQSQGGGNRGPSDVPFEQSYSQLAARLGMKNEVLPVMGLHLGDSPATAHSLSYCMCPKSAQD